MGKIGHAYKTGKSFAGYVRSSFVYHLFTVLYFIFRLFYIPLTILRNLSFFIGMIGTAGIIVYFIKDYYPSHYTVAMVLEAHADTGAFDGFGIVKLILTCVAVGLLTFAFVSLFMHFLTEFGQFLNSTRIQAEENKELYANRAKEHSGHVIGKHMSMEQEMELFKQSANYVPPCKMFGYKETATTYYRMPQPT